MAAGQGFKTFTTGEVLTAGDVNGYLMQGINVFANATARDAAITAPAEGQFAFTKDNNSLWYYDGAAWVASGATGDIEGVSVTSPITGGGTSGTVTIGIDSTAVVPSQTGNAGKYLTTNGTAASWATVASGGLNWTSRSIGSIGWNVYTMAYNGSNLYVIAGEAGNLLTSPDLVTWTSRTSGFGANNIVKVIYANSIWVAVGTAGTITTSTDGITWTARTSNFSTNRIRDIYYAAGYFVAVGDGGGATNTGGIIYSTNGTTWTRVSMTPTIGTNYYTVTYNGTNWLVGTSISTNNYLYASNPTGTWTAGASNIGSDIASLLSDGTNSYIIYNNDAALYRNSSPTLAAASESAMGVTFTKVAGGIGAGNTTNSPLYMASIVSGTIYALGFYYQTFSTTLLGTVPQNVSQLSLAPSTVASNTSPAFYAAASNQGILVTSLGSIVFGSNGRIWSTY